ncbi:MAG: glycoside-pentoside-hexuronide (GPH):cation symporter [Clostridia bacterium]|nr:glycoside-pentoside-hexuronide (GPH):cation symporter [Clostridia bacterium]
MASLNENKLLRKFFGTDPTKKEEMQPSEVLSYSVAGLGQNIICQLVTAFFMVYLTDVVGTPAIWLSIMFLAARLFDAFNDPIMGTIVDRTRSKLGKMRPYLLYSPIPIAVLTVLLFTTFPNWSAEGKFAYSTIIYLLWGIAYTSVDVPYWGLASSMTSDTDKRNTLLTVARLFCTIGSGLISVAIPIFTDTNPETQTFKISQDALKWIYPVIALVCVLIAVPTFWIGFKNSKERFYEDKEKASLKDNLKLLAKNKPVLLMILVGVLGGLRTIYMTTAVYIAKYNFLDQNLASVIFLLVVPGGLAATLLTPILSKKLGKRDIMIWSHLIGGALLVVLYLIGLPSSGQSNVAKVFFYIIIIIAGIPSGFSNILTYSMIADSIDYLEDKTGKRAEGICFSMQTLISKIGMALTAFVTLLVLGLAGYDNADKVVTQESINLMTAEELATYNSVIKNNWMATTLLCGISMAACAIPLFFYTFTEKRQVEAVSRVLARKKAAGTMNEAEAGEFIQELKLVDKKTQERTYSEVAQILGWENADAVRAFIVESDNAKATTDVVEEKVQNVYEDAGITQEAKETEEVKVEEDVKTEEEVKDDSVEETDKSDFDESNS